MKTILFPCYPYDLKNVEPDFEVEYNAAKLAGFDVVLFSHDELTDENKVKLNKAPKSDMLLRGWMIHTYEYHYLYDIIKNKYNVEIINNPTQYSNCHYFPRLYPFIKEDTPEIKTFIPDARGQLKKCKITFVEYFKSLDISQWRIAYVTFQKLNSDCVLKDFVKSEKGGDLFMLKREISFDDFVKHINKFVDARGNLFNAGLVFKKSKHLKKYLDYTDNFRLKDEVTNEWRAFYLNKKLVHLSLNIDTKLKVNEPPIELVEKYQDKIDSNFFTLDFAQLFDDSWIIIEGGDGQVSGLTPHSTPIGFYNLLKF